MLYYRAGWSCYRAGGNICYADTPTAINREHAIFNADRCVAVNPSDTSPALIALQAEMVIRSGEGERVVPAEEYFIGPGTDITRMTVLQTGELLTSIRLPAAWAGAHFYFEKVADRNVWDFPLVNVAAATVMSGDTIARMRIAVNGVAATPLRLPAVENAVRGRKRDEATAAAAGELAIAGAVPCTTTRIKCHCSGISFDARSAERSPPSPNLRRHLPSLPTPRNLGSWKLAVGS